MDSISRGNEFYEKNVDTEGAYPVDDTIEYDLDDEQEAFVKIKTKHSPSARTKSAKKASYESNADVQRWLKLQAPEDGGIKPAFNPTFLASQRDAPWILSSLTQFYEEDLITDVLHMVKSGKEASVYCCAAHPSTGMEYLAAKVYRPRMFRSLRNDAIYRESRVQHDREGRVIRDDRGRRGLKRKNEQGRAAQVSSWIEYEFETQILLHRNGVRVPAPISQMGNAVLMEYIGAVNESAPLLHEVTLEQEEAGPLFENIMHDIEVCLACGRIHGDLSEYNILYWQGSVILIDFAQAVDPGYNQQAGFTLFLRDIERICRYFARSSVSADATALATDIWTRYMGSMNDYSW
jgi:RIO kinase 1